VENRQRKVRPRVFVGGTIVSTDSQSHVSPVVREPNAATRVRSDFEIPRVTEAQLSALYRRVIDASAVRPWAHGAREGYRLAWAKPGGELGFLDLRRKTEAFAVLGRHERCDIELDDRELACRHLVARPIRLPDGSLAIRLVDLRADLPFFLVDDEPHRSIVASGPLAFRLGRHGVVALPMGTDVPCPKELTPPAIRVERTPPLADMRRLESTCITVLPAASSVADMIEPRGVLTPLGPGDARILVARQGTMASIHVEASELDRGVLVGRLPRCVDGGVPSVLSAQISRVHVAIFREADRVVALDTGSTNGMFLGKKPVRLTVLEDAGTTLTLAEGRGAVRLRFERNTAAGPTAS
jgi:hypothetical protein